MSDIVEGRVVKYIPGSPPRVLIEAEIPNLDRALLRQYQRVLVEMLDDRHITDDQRKKAWALVGEIAEWQGDLPPAVHWLMKMKFKVEQLKSLRRDIFSLSDCDVTTAREYITYLIDFMLRWGVPSKRPLWDMAEDVERYVYSCLMNRRCAVCGHKGELHHVDRVGMGRNRDDIFQLGMQVLPLCREHHQEAHNHGDAALMDKHHLESIPITLEIGKVYKLTVKNLKPQREETA